MNRERTIVKTIPMDDDDMRRLRAKFRLGSLVRHRINALILDMIEEMSVRENEAWDEVASRAGFKNSTGAHEQGFSSVLDYGSKTIQLVASPGEK